MPDKTIIPSRNYFPKIQEAREKLAEEALNIYQMFLDTIVEARAAGDFEASLKAQQWLIEHFPKNQEGVGLVDVSVDKVAKEATKAPQQGPTLNLGINLGGMPSRKRLPAVTVEATPIPDADPDPDTK